MNWQISNAKDAFINYLGDAGAVPVSEAVAELWRKYLAEAAPKNAGMAWDHLQVELWLDSGRISSIN